MQSIWAREKYIKEIHLAADDSLKKKINKINKAERLGQLQNIETSKCNNKNP